MTWSIFFVLKNWMRVDVRKRTWNDGEKENGRIRVHSGRINGLPNKRRLQWTSFSDEKVLQLMNIGSPVTGTIGCRPIGRTVWFGLRMPHENLWKTANVMFTFSAQFQTEYCLLTSKDSVHFASKRLHFNSNILSKRVNEWNFRPNDVNVTSFFRLKFSKRHTIGGDCDGIFSCLASQ